MYVYVCILVTAIVPSRALDRIGPLGHARPAAPNNNHKNTDKTTTTTTTTNDDNTNYNTNNDDRTTKPNKYSPSGTAQFGSAPAGPY